MYYNAHENKDRLKIFFQQWTVTVALNLVRVCIIIRDSDVFFVLPMNKDFIVYTFKSSYFYDIR